MLFNKKFRSEVWNNKYVVYIWDRKRLGAMVKRSVFLVYDKDPLLILLQLVHFTKLNSQNYYFRPEPPDHLHFRTFTDATSDNQLCDRVGDPFLSRRVSSMNPDSKVHGTNMGPRWGRQNSGGPHAGPMNFAIWEEPHNRYCFPISSDIFKLMPITKKRCSSPVW